MSAKFWVGGAGTWNATNTPHWSALSGGAGGASAPTNADDVFFDSASNATAYTVTIAIGAVCQSATFGNPASGALTMGGTGVLNCNGNFTIAVGVTRTWTGTLNLGSSLTTKTITFNGTVMANNTTFNTGAVVTNAGTWTLQDDWNNGTNSIQFSPSGSNLVTLDINGKNVICGGFSSSGAVAHTLTLGTGTVTCTAWSFPTSGAVLNAASSTITTSGNFTGGGRTYGIVILSGATPVIANNNTFGELKNTNATAHTIGFTAGSTQTIAKWTISGTAGNLITITTSAAGTATHALIKTGNVVSADFLAIAHSVATPLNTWFAGLNSTNNQAGATAGSGWIFTPPGNFFM